MDYQANLLKPNYNEFMLADLKDGMEFAGYVIVRSISVRKDKNGRDYLDMTVADRSGEINCKCWTVDPAKQIPEASDIIGIRGPVTEYNGRMQLKALAHPYVPGPSEKAGIRWDLLIAAAPESSADMRRRIDETIDRFANEDLKKLVREMLRMAGDKLEYFPAAQRMHHAERGGLLHHTTGMLTTAEHIIESYPFLNGDLLRAGVILHDLAKIDEMDSDSNGTVKDYTADGVLIGHLVRGVVNLELAAKNVGVTGEIVLLLEHMIISHHGVPEYGSPRAPLFPEAEVLHWIDLLDARMNELQTIQNRVAPGGFSERIFSLDNRRIYHPVYTEHED